MTVPNTIDFDIPGTGPFTIEPTSALPAITSPAVIDGYSEPGAQPNTNGPRQGMNPVILIELDGAKTSGANGLQIQAGQSTVEGLAIGGFTAISTSTLGGIGILLQAQTGDLIQGNFIGTDATGAAALPNAVGIEDTSRFPVGSSGSAPAIGGLNTIGGAVPGAGNIISGNTGAGLDLQADGEVYQARDLIQGNFIGIDVTGTRPLPNGGAGIDDAGGGSTIGGTASGTGNVISGNGASGLLIDAYAFFPGSGVLGSNDLVEGNLIGTDATGTSSLPNVGDGIADEGSFSTIGGTAAGDGNILSGNGAAGLEIFGIVNIFGHEADDRIEGNLIGTDITGTRSLPNGGDGIKVAGDYNTIGGSALGARNIISGNVDDGLNITGSYELVEGNFIGTDSTGAQALPNASGIVIDSSSQNTIGGTAAGAGNVISGNTSAGIDLANTINYPFVPELSSTSSDNLIEGNFIGTDAAGTQALPNATGIDLDVSDSNTIGGTAAGAGNLISGNLNDGIGFLSTSVVEGAGTIEAGYFYVSSNDNLIEGNLIGTDPTGTIALGNGGDGVSIGGGSDNTIGATTTGGSNVIAFNGGSGSLSLLSIALRELRPTALTQSMTRFPATPSSPTASWALISAAMASPPTTGRVVCRPQYAPALPRDHLGDPDSSRDVDLGDARRRTIHVLPRSSSSPTRPADPSGFGQGKTDLGSLVVTTDASGHASFSFTSGLDLLGQSISATATDPSGNTSEFGGDVTVGYGTTTSLIGPGQSPRSVGRPLLPPWWGRRPGASRRVWSSSSRMGS